MSYATKWGITQKAEFYCEDAKHPKQSLRLLRPARGRPRNDSIKDDYEDIIYR